MDVDLISFNWNKKRFSFFIKTAKRINVGLLFDLFFPFVIPTPTSFYYLNFLTSVEYYSELLAFYVSFSDILEIFMTFE
ncbi:hypothetical protein CH369_04195 [Leptospira levettii]|nr:hypothetical protein CH368_18135 [Leptospira levettii]PKA01009.1 hypothetical protein CH369_04195 [Leptospira levettii]